jgi:drug/metabolite transporter (DMT)-like permease
MILLPLNPIAALTAGSLWLGEPLGIGLFIGLVLVIIGVLLVVVPYRSVTLEWTSWRGNQK